MKITGAISKDEVLVQLREALASVVLSEEAPTFEIEYSQTVRASLQLPGGENITQSSPQGLQLRAGIAATMGGDVTVDDVALVNGRRRRAQEPYARRMPEGFYTDTAGHRRQVQESATVTFRVTAGADLSQIFEDESFVSTLVEHVNAAGGELILDSNSVSFFEQPSYSTQVTYTVRWAISSNSTETDIEALRSAIRSDEFAARLTDQLADSHPGVLIASVTYPGELCEGNPCVHGNCTERVQSGAAVRLCDCEEGYVFDENDGHGRCRGIFDTTDDADADKKEVDWGYAFGALVLVLGLFLISWMLKGQELRFMLFRPKPQFRVATHEQQAAHAPNDVPTHTTHVNTRYGTPAKQATPAARVTSVHAGYGTQMYDGRSTPFQSYPSPSAAVRAQTARLPLHTAPHWSTMQSTAGHSAAAERWHHSARQVSMQRQVTRISRNVPRDLDAATIARLV
jgi:hypothetical protein